VFGAATSVRNHALIGLRRGSIRWRRLSGIGVGIGDARGGSESRKEKRQDAGDRAGKGYQLYPETDFRGFHGYC